MSGQAPRPLRVGVLLFEGFEVLDVFGPVEVFCCPPAKELVKEVTFLRLEGAPERVTSGQGSVHVCTASTGAASLPELDVLLVPGGKGTRRLVTDERALGWLRDYVSGRPALRVLSVCTGSAVLAAAGVLDGRRATSNKLSFGWVASQRAQVEWVREARWVVDGRFWTSAGVSAGTDMALAFVAHLGGEAAAQAVARFAEWTGDWHDPGNDPWGRLIADAA